jgi:DNA-binding MarR family transcriptional regulator
VDVDLAALFRDLVHVETDLWNAVDAQVRAQQQLPLAVLEVMQVIAVTPQCRVLDIARALSITVGGASKVVDKAQRSTWCRRRPNPDDGRSSLIELTPAGRRLLAEADVTYRQSLADALHDAMPAADLHRLATDLAGLRRHLDVPEHPIPELQPSVRGQTQP